MSKKQVAPKKRSGGTKRTRRQLSVDLFVACDAVSRDPNTGKFSLYGLFDVVFGEEFPLTYGNFALFAQLSGAGEHEIMVELVPPRSRPQELAKLRADLKPDDHAALHIAVGGITFKKPGAHRVQVRSGDNVLASRILNVKKRLRKKQ